MKQDTPPGSEADFAPRVVSEDEVDRLVAVYSNEGRWGRSDELGSGNHVTPERIIDASRLVRSGRTFSLSLPLGREGPQTGWSSRINPQHVMLVTPDEIIDPSHPGQRFADDAVYMPLQTGTQWDALSHMFYKGKGYNGTTYDSVSARHGALRNGIANFQSQAVGRGVLLDVARWCGRDWLQAGESIQSGDLEQCAEAQGIDIRTGDFVLVRTGQLAHANSRGSWEDYAGGPAPGLGVSCAELLCSRDVVAVATDTWGVEAKPYESKDVLAPLHAICLTAAGIYLGEMWDMEALARDCERDKVYEFMLVAQPLPVTGGTGSPVNPIAIK